MALLNKMESIRAFEGVASRQGGSFFLHSDRTYYASEELSRGANPYISPARSLRTKSGIKFKFSIYNYATNTEELELGLLVNPRDIQIGQSFIASSAYTRQAWVTSMWGHQQKTIVCSGTSAAFYIGAGVGTVNKVFKSGITAEGRRESLGFINLLSLVGLYRNNGNYFLDGNQNESLYSNRGRVINVMDSILLSYDDSEYVGSFNSFTLDETVGKPFSLNYNFEFVVSCLRGEGMDGHLRFNGNDRRDVGDPQIPIAIQGFNSNLKTTVDLIESDLSLEFRDDADSADKFNGVGSVSGDDTPDSEGSGPSQLLEKATAQSNGVGTIVSTSSGDRTRVVPTGTKMKDYTSAQIAANVQSLNIKTNGASKSAFNNVLKYLNSPVGSSTSSCSTGTVADRLLVASKVMGYKMDPTMFVGVIANEAGNKFKGGVVVPYVLGDAGRKNGDYAIGVGQMLKSTYNDVSKSSIIGPKGEKISYKAYMKELNFSETNESLLQTDPIYALCTSLFLMKMNSKGVEGNFLAQGVAYNAGSGILTRDGGYSAYGHIEYIKKLTTFMDDGSLVTSANKTFRM